MTLAIPYEKTPKGREERKARALEIWKASGGSSNPKLSDSLLGDVLELALTDFASIYKCMRGHDLDPQYWVSIKHDILIAIEATARAEASR